MLTSHCSAKYGLLAKDLVILNHGQVKRATPEMTPPLLTTTPHQREDVSALDRFNVHRCPTRRVLSGTGIELVTRQATIRYLYHSATAATHRSPTRFFSGTGLELVTRPPQSDTLTTSKCQKANLKEKRIQPSKRVAEMNEAASKSLWNKTRDDCCHKLNRNSKLNH
ncbi:uncharacterized protein TNCV_5137061 [Trichonephila clavipes]|nr:uncharacterized protein TNCV_5137061 [Trichonephila clavipes]